MENPKRLDSVLDIVDASMFECHRTEFELLISDIQNPSLNGILLNDKLEVYDEQRLKKELIVLLHKFYSKKLISLKYDQKLTLKEKSFLLRKVQDSLRQLKLGKLVCYNL